MKPFYSETLSYKMFKRNTSSRRKNRKYQIEITEIGDLSLWIRLNSLPSTTIL